MIDFSGFGTGMTEGVLLIPADSKNGRGRLVWGGVGHFSRRGDGPLLPGVFHVVTTTLWTGFKSRQITATSGDVPHRGPVEAPCLVS